MALAWLVALARLMALARLTDAFADDAWLGSRRSFGSHELDRNEAKADVGEASEKYVYREEENASKETLTLENELSLSP